MTDPELFSHLMAEITARFENLAGEASKLQDPALATDSRLGRFCMAADQAVQLAQGARILLADRK